jgi:hypothetical protein
MSHRVGEKFKYKILTAYLTVRRSNAFFKSGYCRKCIWQNFVYCILITLLSNEEKKSAPNV